MATFLLDTGVLLGYVRGAAFAAYVEKKFAPSRAPNLAVTSIVSNAELQSMALRRKWGSGKLAALATVLRSMPAVPIRQPSVIEKFAEIDAFNHRQHPTFAHRHRQ